MKALIWLLQINLLPPSTGIGLLVLRLATGASMLALHGAAKIVSFASMSESFFDPFGIGSKASLILVILSEVTGSILIILGLFTRLAALAGVAAMAVALFMFHKGSLSGPGSGELALLYLIAYLVLFICGGGRFSIDNSLGSRNG